MFDLFKRFRRCPFCGGRDNLQYIRGHGIYGGDGRYLAYHHACLRAIAYDPEHYSNKDVDVAVELIDLIESKEQRRQEKIRQVMKKYEYLREHFPKEEV